MKLSTMKRAVPALLAVAGLALASVGCTAPAPDIYVPGTGSNTPGTVIKKSTTSLAGSADITAVALQYRSRSATNQANVVTGSVYVPKAPWTGGGSRPIVSVAQGTQGLGDACAPSKSLAQGTNYELPFIQALIARGWAVAVTDYEGLGTPSTHTYIAADAEAHAQLDVVRAALKVPELGLAANAPIALSGYSQGGQSTARAAEIEGTYAPELNVVGAAAGGVPSNPEQLGTTLNGGPFFAFLALAAVGLDAAYPELDLETYLSPAGQTLLENNSQACVGDGLINLGFQTIENLTTTNPLTTPAWQARLDQNHLGKPGDGPEIPVMMYHQILDEIIPYNQGTELRDAWCAQGTQVQWFDMFTGEHALGIFQGQDGTLNFLNQRFTGAPVTPTCNA